MLRVLTIAAICVALTTTLASCSTAGGTAAATPAVAQVQSPATAGTPFRATGNEPSWRLDIGSTEMTLLTNFGQDRLVAATPTAQVSGGTTTVRRPHAPGRTDGDDRQPAVRRFDERHASPTVRDGRRWRQDADRLWRRPRVAAAGRRVDRGGDRRGTARCGFERDARLRAGRSRFGSCLLQQVHERLHAFGRGTRHFQGSRHQDDVRRGPDGPGTQVPRRARRRAELLDRGRRRPAPARPATGAPSRRDAAEATRRRNRGCSVRSHSMRQTTRPAKAAARCLSVWPLTRWPSRKQLPVERLQQLCEHVAREHPVDVVAPRVARGLQQRHQEQDHHRVSLQHARKA